MYYVKLVLLVITVLSLCEAWSKSESDDERDKATSERASRYAVIYFVIFNVIVAVERIIEYNV